MYGKVFESMFEGSLYGQWEAIVTMQQLIVIANEDGIVDMTPAAISGKTSIPLEILTKGLEILAAPDPYTRTPGNDGQRIELIDEHRPWGWSLCNYGKYRDMVRRGDKLKADRDRLAVKREATKHADVAKCRKVSQEVADVAYTDTDTNTDKEQKNSRQVATISPLAKSADADDYREFAGLMWQKIQSLTNQQKTPNIEAWADEIRKLVEIDRQPLPTAWEVFTWANKDKFWQGNILSASTFRKQFPKLYAQSRGHAPVDFSAIARNHMDIF
jgi:hypothetical protein